MPPTATAPSETILGSAIPDVTQRPLNDLRGLSKEALLDRIVGTDEGKKGIPVAAFQASL